MGMSEATYTPHPGTIAARVLAWFAKQAPDVEVTTGVLAEAMDQPMASVITSLEPAFEHGLIAREKRDGRLYWSVSPLRLRSGALGGPPPVTADDDEVDTFPIRQRTVPASTAGGVSLLDRPAWAPPKEATMTSTLTPPQPKKPRVAAPAFDPLAIELKKDRALPPNTRGAAKSRYLALIERMQPGDSVDMHPIAAKSLISAAKKANVKLATRILSEEVTGVWRL